ncbi:MAG: hypothetical protein Unbinned338contig1000_37 [Prokaryotic dsDNA virus sp.]|nr:MAG: hypothetical protein Unbinned338contig1000_37 [Prokaryotic dsDNA virus sp.]|tara:strand:+ start:21117 stop:22427 length:1311 start_codon:yes stop_codon:yes gene_type:complete
MAKLPFIDGLRNIVANLGTERDKASQSHYVLQMPSDAELSAAYRTSATARKVVDMPAEDMAREWREWQGNSDQIELIEAEEKRLGIQGKVMQAKIKARLFGGAAIYIGTGEQNGALPLNVRAIKKGGVKYLTVIPRTDLNAGEIETDPRLPGYGLPRFYTIGVSQDRIHPSRLVLMRGEELPDDNMAGVQQGWGDSSLASCFTHVTNLDAVVANVVSLTYEANVDVVGIKGFNDGLKSFGEEYEKTAIQRASLQARGKGINGMLMIDADDTYNRKSASFATLPDLMDRFMQLVSAASSIPVTRLFGISPGGMNATGESDEKVYTDRIKSMQTLELEPALSVLDECLIQSALGSRPAEIFYNWRPLYVPSFKERSENAERMAKAFQLLNDMNLLPAEVLSETLVNVFTELGVSPGLQGAVDKYFKPTGETDLSEGED